MIEVKLQALCVDVVILTPENAALLVLEVTKPWMLPVPRHREERREQGSYDTVKHQLGSPPTPLHSMPLGGGYGACSSVN